MIKSFSGAIDIPFRNYSVDDYVRFLQGGCFTFRDVSKPWSDEKQSLYIEAILMYMPLHQITVFDFGKEHQASGRYEVLDGNNRLKTIARWHEDELELIGLTLNPELNGHRFSSLRKSLKNDPEGFRTIPLCQISSRFNSPFEEKHKLEISRRLNGV